MRIQKGSPVDVPACSVEAIRKVKDGMAVREAVQRNDLPRTTLSRHLKTEDPAYPTPEFPRNNDLVMLSGQNGPGAHFAQYSGPFCQEYWTKRPNWQFCVLYFVGNVNFSNALWMVFLFNMGKEKVVAGLTYCLWIKVLYLKRLKVGSPYCPGLVNIIVNIRYVHAG